MKEARGMLKAGRVLSAKWESPNLLGLVQGGAGVLKSGLIIRDRISIDNICSCPDSRRWGKICGHSIAVGLRVLRPELVEQPVVSETKPAATDQSPTLEQVISLAASKDEGVSILLHVVLPPNFEQALSRSKATVCFEFERNGKRRPLNLLPTEEKLYFDERDLALLRYIVGLAEGQLPAMLQLDMGGFVALLDKLSGHPRLSLGRKSAIEVSDEPFDPGVRANLLQTGEIELRVELPETPPVLLPGAVFWVFSGNRFQPLNLPSGGAGLLQGSVRLKREQVPAFLQNEFPALAASPSFAANFTLADFEFELAAPEIHLHLEGGLGILYAKLEAVYSGERFDLVTASENMPPWIVDEKNPRRYQLRDLGVERQCAARLVRFGFAGPKKNGRLELRGQDAVLPFLSCEFPRLQAEWKVALEERLEWSIDTKVERIEPRCEITPSGEQWFDFSMQFESTGGEKFSAADIQRLVLGGQSHTKLRNGKYALLDTGAVEELQEVLIDTAPKQSPDGFRFRSDQAAYLTATLEQRNGWKVATPRSWQEGMGSVGKVSDIDLGKFKNILRPYQAEGIRWLCKLRSNGFGGILADEMGLGKTLQALAYVSITRRSSDGAGSGPCLVVCPTSLVFNWVAEAEKFAPGLKVLALQGASRARDFKRIADCDLIVTSYALLRRDAGQYGGVEFDTVILDEAQHIKNRQTQNALAVKSVACRHRLVLTGTPMENSVLDLWSIFDFLMPGYLGAVNDFRDRYEVPLAKSKDPVIQDRLGRRVRPFILRRLKREVAKDLPDKIEQVSYCELTTDQRAVYQQILDAGRKEVLESVDKNGFGKSRMVIFTALLRLRQICCDLRLLKSDASVSKSPSGKMEMFNELLEEIVDGDHRVLVFSQFTTMLGLLREQLDEAGVEFCYLDGSTTNRGEVVNRFQRGKIPVFLISLKAGGVGLNLTGADTVIHFDPWWNPAIEDQATGRAHRIGQNRVVTSFKLITRDTVEEKILKLQEKKRTAISAVFGGEEQLSEALNWDDVQDLFA